MKKIFFLILILIFLGKVNLFVNAKENEKICCQIYCQQPFVQYIWRDKAVGCEQQSPMCSGIQVDDKFCEPKPSKEIQKGKIKTEPEQVTSEPVKLSPTTYLEPLKNAITEGLKCGKSANSALQRIFNCLFEAIALLKNLALILLTIAIIGSALYLITTPLFGLKNISRAWQILIWSIIGLVIILLADVIKAQIERLTK